MYQGEPIQDSPAELSAQMKALVREQLANGKREQEVLDYFVQKYGQWILLEPKAEGINLLVYWLPVFFLVIGAGWYHVGRQTVDAPPSARRIEEPRILTAVLLFPGRGCASMLIGG